MPVLPYLIEEIEVAATTPGSFMSDCRPSDPPAAGRPGSVVRNDEGAGAGRVFGLIERMSMQLVRRQPGPKSGCCPPWRAKDPRAARGLWQYNGRVQRLMASRRALRRKPGVQIMRENRQQTLRRFGYFELASRTSGMSRGSSGARSVVRSAASPIHHAPGRLLKITAILVASEVDGHMPSFTYSKSDPTGCLAYLRPTASRFRAAGVKICYRERPIVSRRLRPIPGRVQVSPGSQPQQAGLFRPGGQFERTDEVAHRGLVVGRPRVNPSGGRRRPDPIGAHHRLHRLAQYSPAPVQVLASRPASISSFASPACASRS